MAAEDTPDSMMRKCASGPCRVFFYYGTECPACGTVGIPLSTADRVAHITLYNAVQPEVAGSLLAAPVVGIRDEEE